MLSPAMITKEPFGPLGVSRQIAEAEMLRARRQQMLTGRNIPEPQRGIATYRERGMPLTGSPKANLQTPTKIIVKGTPLDDALKLYKAGN